MPADANMVLQASVVRTATGNGTGVDLKVGTPPRPLFARIVYSAASNASGSNTVTFEVQHSADNSTYYTAISGAKDVVTLSTTVQAGEIYLPILTKERYARLTATFAGAGSTPTITYKADMAAAAPRP